MNALTVAELEEQLMQERQRVDEVTAQVMALQSNCRTEERAASQALGTAVATSELLQGSNKDQPSPGEYS